MSRKNVFFCGVVATLGLSSMVACGGGSTAKQASGVDGPPPSAPSSPSPPGTAPASPAPGTPGSFPGTSPDPGPPAVQVVGRFDTRDPDGPVCAWPGCRIIVNVQDAPRVTVRLKEHEVMAGPSEWDVAVDGQWKTPKLVLHEGEQEIELAAGLSPGSHRIELYKRTEAQNGYTQFLGFDYHGGTLLPPPLRSTRRLEIVGDSDVTGFGYEGSLGADCNSAPVWSAKFENFRLAWGERLTQRLGAELHGTAYSGKGFYYNIWRPDTETIGILYPLANPIDPSSTYDLSSWIPDAVVVSIGGNDYNIGQPQDFGAAPLDGFTQKAREFTTMLRKAYPQAHIFLMAYAVLTDTDPPGRLRRTNVETALKTVTSEHVAAGDTRVYFVAPPQYDPEELTACDGHGGPSYHERIAVYMAAQMAPKLGW